VNQLQILIIRAALGVFFAFVLTRFFHPEADIQHVIGLAVIMVGLAYFSEYLRNRRRQKEKDVQKGDSNT
jgi:hypothetical protein